MFCFFGRELVVGTKLKWWTYFCCRYFSSANLRCCVGCFFFLSVCFSLLMFVLVRRWWKFWTRSVQLTHVYINFHSEQNADFKVSSKVTIRDHWHRILHTCCPFAVCHLVSSQSRSVFYIYSLDERCERIQQLLRTHAECFPRCFRNFPTQFDAKHQHYQFVRFVHTSVSICIRNSAHSRTR